MASIDKTPLGLNQWVGGDRPKMTDFNSDNQRIDLVCREVLETLGGHLEKGGHVTEGQTHMLEEASVHGIEGIATEAGVHGLRYYNSKVQVNVGGIWENMQPEESAYKVYGVCIDTANTDPVLAVTRTDDAVGLVPQSPQWEESFYGKIRPCVLKEGEVQYYLNPDDYKQKEDNTGAGHLDGSQGDVMVEIPRLAYAIYSEGEKLYVKVTDHPNAKGLDVRYCYLGHTRDGEGDRQRLYIGAYLGSVVNGRLRSLSGQTAVNRLIQSDTRLNARANGQGYDLVGFYPYMLIQCLYLVRYGSLNSQAAVGTGRADVSSALPAGGADQRGMYWGDSGYVNQMKCLGIEDLWGNLYYYLDGFHIDSTGGVYTGTRDFNSAASGYKYHGKLVTATKSGYIGQVYGSNDLGFLIKETGGGVAKGYCDKGFLTPNCGMIAGGCYLDWNDCGIFTLFARDYGSTSAQAGARLMYL